MELLKTEKCTWWINLQSPGTRMGQCDGRRRWSTPPPCPSSVRGWTRRTCDMRTQTGRGWYRCRPIWFPFEPAQMMRAKGSLGPRNQDKTPTLHPSPFKMLSSLEGRRKDTEGELFGLEAQWRGLLSQCSNPQMSRSGKSSLFVRF